MEEGRLGVVLLQAVMAWEVSTGSSSHAGVALPSCLESLSSSKNILCLNVCIRGMEQPVAPSEYVVKDYTPGCLGSFPHDMWSTVKITSGSRCSAVQLCSEVVLRLGLHCMVMAEFLQ